MKNARTLARKYGAKVVAIGGALALAAPAFATTDPVGDMFAAISLGTVAAAVGAVGLLVVGITMAFKAIDLSKRGVRKV